MDFKTLIFEKDGTIGRLTVNRPEKMNALSTELVDELATLLGSLEGDPGMRALIITGVGNKAFVAGADIQELAGRGGPEGIRVSRRRQDVFARIEHLPFPAIAAVNGYALGGGLELALACTLRLCSSNAQFGAPEVKLGIIPGDGGTQRLARLIGPGRALEMILMGDFVDAQEAHRIGLVNRVCPPEELMPKAMETARTLASRPPLAVRFAKEAVNRGLESSAAGYALETALHALCCATEDKNEGVAAFLEKRTPDFRGK